MVEGGQIDWVAHGNDVASVLHELTEFDKAVGVAMSFAESSPDTLVIVTADHETGGLAIAYNDLHPPPRSNWRTGRPGGRDMILRKKGSSKKWPGRRNPS